MKKLFLATFLLLLSLISVTNGQGITNPSALATLTDINNLQPPSTAIGAFQAKMQSAVNDGATVKELDAMVQQFTQSMAAASYAQTATANTQILQLVGSQLMIPWKKNQLIRAQNSLQSTAFPYASRLSSSYASKSTGWFQATGYTGEQEMKDSFAAYDFRGWGFALGIDRSFGNTLVGLAYGNTDNHLKSQKWLGTPNPSDVNTLTHTFLTYGITRLGPRAFIAGKLGMTLAEMDGSRIPSANYSANWATSAQTLFLQSTLGCLLVQSKRFSLAPKARFSYFNYDQAEYDEQWSDATTQHVAGWQDGYCELDFLIDYCFVVSGSLNFTGSFGLREVIGAEGAVLSTDTAGMNYEVRGVAPSSEVFVVDFGLDLALSERMTLVTEYNMRAGSGGSNLHSGTGTLLLNF